MRITFQQGDKRQYTRRRVTPPRRPLIDPHSRRAHRRPRQLEGPRPTHAQAARGPGQVRQRRGMLSWAIILPYRDPSNAVWPTANATHTAIRPVASDRRRCSEPVADLRSQRTGFHRKRFWRLLVAWDFGACSRNSPLALEIWEQVPRLQSKMGTRNIRGSKLGGRYANDSLQIL